jgi:hypothetical protein
VDIDDGIYWTSGTDNSEPNHFTWCSLKAPFYNSQILWRAGNPDNIAGDCVNLEVKKDTLNETYFATSNCNEKHNYICESYQKGTDNQGHLTECKAIWEISDGKKIGAICCRKGKNLKFLEDARQVLLTTNYTQKMKV